MGTRIVDSGPPPKERLVYTAVGIVAVLLLVFAIDRLGLFAERRGWVYWRKRNRPSGASAGVFGEMQSLMSPSYRHVVEEQQRQQISRIDHSTAAPPLDVDLEKGTAILRHNS
ncbi:DUF6191 domain-containing protein [Rhodococcus artemisiae]|uniref:DUF6191 domain-containing protein n=1 Tax=Rhodococcus artemisiae TaxID=714159 RepID=A0ABU7L7A2_9NOCA|nr:DUF6191 domain-containing protein [Rhodococcus artemisiae]MEE2057420.1 DUF6191 domain-containing protein [Rhodococcus artemisiae]